MRRHKLSTADRKFQQAFGACEFPASDFDHRAHVRLAYTYLGEGSTQQAHERMKTSLLNFLNHLGVDTSKYHETMTRAWVMAVRHFMEKFKMSYQSADEFIAGNPMLLDSKIMLTHYSAEVLFSPAARTRFVEPDVEPIPEH